ncbi:MAG: SDR family NAD(P)-dependent oxidoreductase [Acidimicrobiia bacterium]
MTLAVVTGPNSGIGREVALGLAATGFHVVAAGRSEQRVGGLVEEIWANGGSAEYVHLDLASLASVRTTVEELLGSGRQVDVLVNNAGIGVNRRGLTEDGFEVHFGINHLGHFALTRGLAPVMTPRARVVSVASAMHHRVEGIEFDHVRRRTRWIGLQEYAMSKLANVLFIKELARRSDDIGAYAVHPGFVDTSLIPGWVKPFVKKSLITPAQGADTVLWCATSAEVSEESGLYYQRRHATTPSPAALDDGLARELWERSEIWAETG